MALRRWKKITTGHYERWHPWRMEVSYWPLLDVWATWVQGEQVVPACYPTRKAAMLACERRAIELIQEKRRRAALWRPLLIDLAKEDESPPAED